MTRIIAGVAGSLRLSTPGSATRPTSDRVREAWFSALESQRRIEGARVLDLYAGSGALGLEAASRGASEVTLVDSHPGAVDVIRRNIRAISPALGRQVSLRAVKASAQTFVEGLAAESLDLVFVDPPYDLATAALEKVIARVCDAVVPGGWVMLERGKGSTEVDWPSSMRVRPTKSYGDTSLVFAEKS